MAIYLHHGDLPPDLNLGPRIAMDTETQGLALHRDRLCLAQLSTGDGDSHLVQFTDRRPDAPNLKALLTDPACLKIFHFARFDVAALRAYLGVWTAPIWCTKIASRLVRTYTDRHGLASLCKELLGVDLSKAQQSSDWSRVPLSEAQQTYAASDVAHLHALQEILAAMLAREGRTDLAQLCFEFVAHRARLDLEGWADVDIFGH